MPTTRFRRIVRRAVMVVVWFVLLVNGYVSSALVLTVATDAGWLPPPTQNAPLIAAYAPLRWYMASEMPGGKLLQKMAGASHEFGRSLR